MTKNLQEELISIIVPVYNCAPFLDRLFTSLQRQNYKDIEIIVIDDGSSDNSWDIINIWKQKDKRILAYRQENQGVSAARNLGIEKSRGKYIAFMDSDDYVDGDYYEKLHLNAVQTKSDIVMVGTIWHTPNGCGILQPYYSITARSLFEKISTLRGGNVNDKLFLKELLINHDIRFPDGHNYEGNIFLLQAVYYANQMYFCPNTFYHYIRRENSICTNKELTHIQKNLNDRCFILQKMYSFAKEKKFSRQENKAMFKYIYRSVLDNKNIYHTNMNIVLKYCRFRIVKKLGIIRVLKYLLLSRFYQLRRK